MKKRGDATGTKAKDNKFLTTLKNLWTTVKEGFASKGKFHIFSIRNKLLVGFLIPIVCMIIIGVASYQTAKSGLSSKYEDSAVQTLQMAAEYVDMSAQFIKSEALKYSNDDEFSKYLMKIYDSDSAKKTNVKTRIQKSIMASASQNSFIQNVFLIPGSDFQIFSTRGNTDNGFLDSYKAEMADASGNLPAWIDEHASLDETLKIGQADAYFLSYQVINSGKNCITIVDMSAEAFQEFIDTIDPGKNGVIGLVSFNGKEIVTGGGETTVEEGTEAPKLFYGTAPYEKALEKIAAGETSGMFRTGNKLFLYAYCDEVDCVVCQLVPESTVIASAESIKVLTLVLVIIAAIVVLAFGILVASGIIGNMNRLSRNMEKVSEGDLMVHFRAKGKDEFQDLAATAAHMVHQTRSLVEKVGGATGDLEQSTLMVNDVSDVLADYSNRITDAIGDINEGMERQSVHAQECVDTTVVLSDEIQKIIGMVERVEALVEKTGQMIEQGMEIVHTLGDRAADTTKVTGEVGDNIEELQRVSESINSFVKTITDISFQTNLLSLNASIEAARAGTAGRGFAVVAEEIRKLADDSAKAANEIKKQVEEISVRTDSTVQSAHSANEMVELQSKAVEDATAIFQEMMAGMTELNQALENIAVATRDADEQRLSSVAAVENISQIIEQNAENAEKVNDVAARLREHVSNLSETADHLGQNMDELKSEIANFKIQ